MLKHSFLPALRAHVALACLAAISSAHADSASLASGQASLTGIRYELIDLRPDDGQAPWIRFANASGEPISGLIDATGSSHAINVAREASWQGLLPADALSVTSADGYASAQASANSLSTSFAVDAAALKQLAVQDDGSGRFEVFGQARTGNGIASLAYVVNEAAGQVSAVDGDTGWQPYDFTLSAHTAVVVHAQASASLTLHPEVGAWNILDTGGNMANEPMIGSGVQVALMLIKPDFAMKPDYASIDAFYADMDQAYQLTFDGLSADWTPDDLATMTPSSRDLLVTLNNDADLEAHGSLLMTGMSQFVVTRAVPEPATWALMGLGLLALSSRGRKASKAHKASPR